ncbi:hypothetical protein GYA93_07185 [Gordonia desulfuricans]|uniref:DUF2029 domain-containing protein n=2 Tax=Gordonia desulfuricans TaxID=89051 RepID=A0A7K3LM90_9ACTN|nr:hypothetical protein [Gordonia desulfuricans]NDK89366.1 hypothetical protein [Gordonia desulfuricans]
MTSVDPNTPVEITAPPDPASAPESAHPVPAPGWPRWARWAVLGAVVVVGLVVRWQFRDIETMDYQAFLSRWYQTLDTQGFGAFRERFADYNYPYLYLIWILTALNIPPLIGIKAVSVIFDLVLAFFAYRIVALRTPRFSVRALAFGVMFLLPSVIANSAWWGQADAIYSAFALGGIYFLLRAQREGITHRAYVVDSVWACVFFGLSLSFKLQAIFVLPVLVWLLLRRRLPWYSLVAIPAVFVLLDLPAIIAGAPWREALSVYLDQTGSYKQLTLGAANLYQLIPIAGDATWLAHLGIGLAAAVIVAFLVWSVWRKPPVAPATTLVVATASSVLVPFLLPAMHDRYFFTAEVLSVVLAFYMPLRFVIIPVLIQAAAIGVYHSSLSGDQGQGFGGGGGGGRPEGAGPGGGGPGGGPRPEASAGGNPGGGPGGNGNGGGPGGGRPGGGMPGGGRSDGYTSGRGDTALGVYATMMGLALLSLVYAVADTVQRARRAVRV